MLSRICSCLQERLFRRVVCRGSGSPDPFQPPTAKPKPVALEEKQDAEEERTLGPNPTLSEVGWGQGKGARTFAEAVT